jgi:hypothetical protein
MEKSYVVGDLEGATPGNPIIIHIQGTPKFLGELFRYNTKFVLEEDQKLTQEVF